MLKLTTPTEQGSPPPPQPTDQPAPVHRATAHAHHTDPEVAAQAVRELEEVLQAKHQRQHARWDKVFALGRTLMGAGFIASGLMQAWRFADTASVLYDLGVGGPKMLLGLAIGLQLLCGAMLAVGFRSRRAALALLGYLVVGALAFHHDVSVELNRAFLLADFALAGGLLMLAAHGSGTESVDQLLERRDARRFGA